MRGPVSTNLAYQLTLPSPTQISGSRFWQLDFYSETVGRIDLPYCSSTMLLLHDVSHHAVNVKMAPHNYIQPIYKNKGDINDPDNYRGITLLSCLGKLFTSVINERLTVFIDTNQIMSEAQAGFRKGYSTTDQIFTLKCIVELFLCQGRRLFCTFVDYSKAFDSINRATLWKKLISCGISGKVLRVILNMYKSIKSCVMAYGMQSELFESHVGLRQHRCQPSRNRAGNPAF